MKSTLTSMPIGISLANCSGIVSDDIYDYIAASANDAILYIPRLSSGGQSRKSGVDAYIILGAVGSIASIGSILWYAYDKFIASKKQQGSDAGISVAIRKADGSSLDLWIGRDVLTKEDLERKWKIEVNDFLTIDSESVPTAEQITHSPDWKKRTFEGEDAP